jgi:alpha-amylase/alpha-mannosidase (GH57 family)
LSDRFVCVHAHIYQPPRDNPWTGRVPAQPSAAPQHDWNERVTLECYAPNTAARILGEDGEIAELVNNYERVSFDAGPTLLQWMEQASPTTYAALLEADVASRERFGGHGNAVAQAHGHLIQPLASERDRRTQILWGVRDFAARFGRDPEGMWLPETAVDEVSLESMAELGIRFTVLAPHQGRALRVESAAGAASSNVAPIDPRHPYRVTLPSGRELIVFFYDHALAGDVAFGQLLRSGDELASRLLNGFHGEPESAAEGTSAHEAQLVHLATDGETFGHHHRFGEMALAWALRRVEADPAVRLTNYGEFLELAPPTRRAEIVPRTSWSCQHGVERWRADCGCRTGGDDDWNQAWRGPLRAGLDQLRDRLALVFEKHTGPLLRDPWQARDDYVAVLLDGVLPAGVLPADSDSERSEFLSTHCRSDPSAEQAATIWRALEMQRHAMAMFTSCGWFFSDLEGIETVQVLLYAARALQLCGQLEGPAEERRIERELLRHLERARGNQAGRPTGREVWRRQVEPLRSAGDEPDREPSSAPTTVAEVDD